MHRGNGLMKRILARTLLAYSTEDLWTRLCEDFILVFDDGQEIVTTYREMLYTSYFWEFHRLYPNTPLKVEHHVSSVIKGKSITASTHERLLEKIFKDVITTYGLTTPISRDREVKLIYEITNYLHNDLVKRTEAFVVSLDILDFRDVVRNPVVAHAMDTVQPSTESISATYMTIMDALMTSEELANNPLAMATKAKLVNSNQVLQCVGPRGYLTDIDSMNFRTPILRGYTQGLRTLYNSLIESRSAAKALFFSEDPLKDAEYFSRRLQLLGMSVERLHYTDCGSTEYITWKVKPPIYKGETKIYAGDLYYMQGKYYVDEATGGLKVLGVGDSHLNNTTIRFRSPVAGCAHPDPRGICAVCFGTMADNMMPEGNLGHNCAASTAKQTSQNVLSTKHHDGSSIVEPITLNDDTRDYLAVDKSASSYFLNKRLKGKPLSVIVQLDDVFGISDILLVKNVEDINISRISQIELIGIKTGADTLDVIKELPISFNGRYGMLTHQALKYVREKSWGHDENGNFVFDMSGWDFDQPFITLPNKQYSMSDHSHDVSEVIEARVEDLANRSSDESPAATLTELFDIVNSKLNVNISLLEVIVYSAMIVSDEKGDYRLPKPWTEKGLGVSTITIPSRSLSCAFAFEGQFATITNPMSFSKMNRPDSPLDVMFQPSSLHLMKSKYEDTQV